MIKNVYINDIEYNVDEGVSLKDKATEELDSLVFRLTNINQITLEPMQYVRIIFNDDTEIKMMVNTWIEEVASIYGLKNYTISCISETKALERVQMPNRTITQPLSSEKRTYLNYIEHAMEYVNQVFPRMTIANEMYELLENEIAVEEQFNSPNAKEYFNSILSKVNCVVKVVNNQITYLDLNQKGNPINESYILFRNYSQTIEDYYSDIRTDIQGVQSEDSTIITELVGIRSPDTAVITYDNAVIKLEHNINFIKEVICYAEVIIDGTNRVIEVPIYNDEFKLIKEKAVYDTLYVSNQLDTSNQDDKRMNLYYVRGSNTIEGLTYTEKTWFLGLDSMQNAIENIIRYVYFESGGTGTLSFFADIRDFKFKVTYSSVDDVSTKFEKKNTIPSVVRDNQVDSYVDLDKFAKVQQEKINRLGNKTLEINARYSSLNQVPNLLDTIGDYVLAEREIIFHRDYIDFKGVLFKDFVKKNFYYGVNAKRRSTQLIMGNEAVVRKELTKENYRFSFEDKGGDKYLQRYLLGNLASASYDGKKVGEYILTGKWQFYSEIISFPLENPVENPLVINAKFKTTFGFFNKMRITYNANSDNTYVLEYYEANTDQWILAYDEGMWMNENRRNLEIYYVGDFNENNSITYEQFYNWLYMNALNEDEQYLEKNEKNKTLLDFKPIQLAVGRSTFNDETSVEYKLEPDVRKGGNSVFINFKWYDNINVGMKVGYKEKGIVETLFQSKGGYGQEYVSYTDSNGELDFLEISLYDDIGVDVINGNYNVVDEFPSIPSGIVKEKNLLYYSNELLRWKDNKEVLNETFQFDFSSEQGIFFTDLFIKSLPLFDTYKKDLYVWVSESEYYDEYNYHYIVESAVRRFSIDYTDFTNFIKNGTTFNRIIMYNNNVDLTGVKSWSIADEDGNVYLAVNKRDSDDIINTTIYLNKEV